MIHIAPETLFIVQAILLIGLPFLFWRVFRFKKITPLVVVQIILGIVLGPTILGTFAPDIYASLFPKGSLTAIQGVATIGLCLLGFLTGLHFDLSRITKRGRAFTITSIGSLIVPALAGAALAWAFFREPYVDPGANKVAFILGLACAIGVTALPVLSAILIELKLIKTRLGERVLGYAAVNDMGLWVIVAGLAVYASQSSGGATALALAKTLSFLAAFLILMVCIVRPLLARLARTGLLTDGPSSTQLALVVSGVLLSCLATQLIELHFIFGAFVFGAIMPKSIASGLYASLEQFTMVVLMPFYFMLTGLRTSFSLNDGAVWTLFACATLVAIVAKIASTSLPERYLNGSSKNEALEAGILMQTKGLMEVVVLNLLYSAGIINTIVFSALLLMAIVTTFLTKPLLLIVRSFSSRRVLAK